MDMNPQITAEQYLERCKRHFGNANPERLHNPVWDWMIREGHNPYAARKSLGLEGNHQLPGDPDWCFDRFGAAIVEMPGGRIITIGGEHEDYYDPEFCIYNEVIVQRGEEIEIYGYPRSVFPPTDFHSATLVGDDIVIIGRVGYLEDRQPDTTPVFRLNTRSYQIEPVKTRGHGPAGLCHHRAAYLCDSNEIEVTGGQISRGPGDRSVSKGNFDHHRLALHDFTWRRMTDNSAWRQYKIQYESDMRHFSVDWESGEALTRLGYPCDLGEDDDVGDTDTAHTMYVGGVPVRVVIKYSHVHLVFQGALAQDDIDALIEKLCEAARQGNHTITETVEL